MRTQVKSRRWKLGVKIGLACVLAGDAGLLYASWRARQDAPASQALRRAQLQNEEQLLAADVARGKSIEQHLPGLGQECQQFYQNNLLPESTGYWSVISNLGDIAQKAGVQMSGINFRETEVKNRGLNEVHITAAVQGNYQSLIQLISGLERSRQFYVLDGLTLASENSGSIKLQLTLRTYFRV